MQNTEVKEQSLHEKLAQATEYKEPTGTTESWFASENEINDIPSPTGTPNTNTTILKEPTEQTSTTQTQSQTKEAASGTKVPDAVKRASAETATLMWDQLLSVLGAWRVNSNFKKKFSEAEQTIILEKNLEDVPEENLTDPVEKTLHSKFHRLLKKRDQKMKNIPLSEDEKSRHEDAFYQVFKIKDIALPPEYLLYANLGFTLIDRIIETEVD